MKIFNRFARGGAPTFAPTPHQLMVRKWNADGGDEALRFNYALDRDSIVLDVGGYEGQWASDLYGRGPCQIHVFEPVSSFAEAIARRFKGNKDIHVHSFGLGGRTRTESITVAGDATSTLRSQAGVEEKIEIVSAVSWIMDHVPPSSEIDLVKVNTEGGEFELLPALIESGVIARIKCLQVQFHEIDTSSAPRMREIQVGLQKTHRPTYQYEFVWEDWRRI